MMEALRQVRPSSIGSEERRGRAEAAWTQHDKWRWEATGTTAEAPSWTDHEAQILMGRDTVTGVRGSHRSRPCPLAAGPLRAGASVSSSAISPCLLPSWMRPVSKRVWARSGTPTEPAAAFLGSNQNSAGRGGAASKGYHFSCNAAQG
ncbi:hypothetical protein MAPG_07014 [Magnaporthiopsis poae ATCC 64411]|uniref:Uncharacterized protein n=1 Tax=Magnaporthiopsis poae (strain ATCC 64411 / 73-15) TaxID=644358 RepID=A0A0C4E3L0_MAGP6|nr:hypothetical protein MAPG_07014 [Magnaporthiopsis poae ATCC 64411]